jgi:hypothetical protein
MAVASSVYAMGTLVNGTNSAPVGGMQGGLDRIVHNLNTVAKNDMRSWVPPPGFRAHLCLIRVARKRLALGLLQPFYFFQ